MAALLADKPAPPAQVRHTDETLTPLAGVRQVHVDVAAKRVRVEYDDQADVGRLRTALADEGYPVAAG